MIEAVDKTEIDRLGERLRRRRASKEDLRTLDSLRRSFMRTQWTVEEAILKRLKLRSTGRRTKSTLSIVNKLRRRPTLRLSRMYDIAGCRLATRSVIEQDRVKYRLCDLFQKAVVKDRRVEPSHGYRAVHVIVEVEQRAVEIQVRTQIQHLWALVSEKLSDLLDPGIKYGVGQRDAQTILLGLSNVLADLERLEDATARRQRDMSRVHLPDEVARPDLSDVRILKKYVHQLLILQASNVERGKREAIQLLRDLMGVLEQKGRERNVVPH